MVRATFNTVRFAPKKYNIRSHRPAHTGYGDEFRFPARQVFDRWLPGIVPKLSGPEQFDFCLYKYRLSITLVIQMGNKGLFAKIKVRCASIFEVVRF